MCSNCSPRVITSLWEEKLTMLENPTYENLERINFILQASRGEILWWGIRKVRFGHHYISLNKLVEKINQCIPTYLNSNDYLLPEQETKKKQWAQICRRVLIMYSESDNAIKERNYITQFLAFIHDILSSIRSVYEKNTQKIRNFDMFDEQLYQHAQPITPGNSSTISFSSLGSGEDPSHLRDNHINDNNQLSPFAWSHDSHNDSSPTGLGNRSFFPLGSGENFSHLRDNHISDNNQLSPFAWSHSPTGLGNRFFSSSESDEDFSHLLRNRFTDNDDSVTQTIPSTTQNQNANPIMPGNSSTISSSSLGSGGDFSHLLRNRFTDNDDSVTQTMPSTTQNQNANPIMPGNSSTISSSSLGSGGDFSHLLRNRFTDNDDSVTQTMPSTTQNQNANPIMPDNSSTISSSSLGSGEDFIHLLHSRIRDDDQPLSSQAVEILPSYSHSHDFRLVSSNGSSEAARVKLPKNRN